MLSMNYYKSEFYLLTWKDFQFAQTVNFKPDIVSFLFFFPFNFNRALFLTKLLKMTSCVRYYDKRRKKLT